MRRPSISRHPVEVEAVGLLSHGKKKSYMFLVMWSDYNKVLIYRSFAEFRKFQRDLKRIFPLEAGSLNKSERTLPKLKDSPRTLAKKKDAKRSLERLQRLETYSQTLLKLDAKISQSHAVVQFFNLKNHDLNPSFPEESLVIVPSERKQEKSLVSSVSPDVSRPLITATYTCVEDYETFDLRNGSFIVKRDEPLNVLMKESTGWWLVENEARQIAWFPAPYLQGDRNNVYTNSNQQHEEGMLCVVIKTYEAQNSDELSVGVGVVVSILRKSDNGWWLVSYNGMNGFVPSVFLKPYKDPYEKIQNILTMKQFGFTPNLSDNEQSRQMYLYVQNRPLQTGERGQEVRSKSLDSEPRSEIESDSGSNSSLNTYTPSSSQSSTPRVPPRPNTNEIMTRCCTITRNKMEAVNACGTKL
ncbi:NADPH oxidase organizer 1-like [Gastrophryne carolinensis]